MATVAQIHLKDGHHAFQKNLPHDVLQEIFLHCLPANHNATLSCFDAPLLLTHVSRTWSSVALHTPRLWTSLHIPSTFPGTQTDSLIEAWVRRSGTLSLSVSIMCSLDHEGNIPRLSRIFDILAPSLLRWSDVDMALQGTIEEMVNLFDHLNKLGVNPLRCARAVRLEFAEIDGDGRRERTFGSVWQDRLFEALQTHNNPRLRHLSLETTFHVRDFPVTLQGTVPWSNLRSLNLQHKGSFAIVRGGDEYSHNAFDMLVKCPNLTTLYTRSPPYPTCAPDTLYLDQLTYLAFHVPDLGHLAIVDLMTGWTFPSLQFLHLSTSSLRQIARIYVLSTAVKKFGESLTSLRFTFPNLKKEHLHELVEALPNLIQLHVEHRRPHRRLQTYGSESDSESDTSDDSMHSDDEGVLLDDEFLAILAPSLETRNPAACSGLQYLRLENDTTITEEAVIDMLRKRSAASADGYTSALKQLQIHFQRSKSNEKDVVVECADLLEAGLRIKLVYKDDARDSLSALRASCAVKRGLRIQRDPLAFGWDL